MIAYYFVAPRQEIKTERIRLNGNLFGHANKELTKVFAWGL